MLLCMLLYMRSSSGYEFLRSNEILPLPCIKTVRRYFALVHTDWQLQFIINIYYLYILLIINIYFLKSLFKFLINAKQKIFLFFQISIKNENFMRIRP